MDRILIAGATVRSAAESAKRAGFRVWAADLFGDRDLRRSAEQVERIVDYGHDLPEFARSLPRRWWMYTGGLENRPEVVEAVSYHHRLLGNSAAVLRQARDPWRLWSVLRASGIAVPQLRRRVPTGTDGIWIWKPYCSCGGTRICRVSAAAGQHGHGRESEIGVSVAEGYYQRYVRGPVFGATYVAAGDGARLVGITRQLAGHTPAAPSRFSYAGSIGPVRLAPGLVEQFRRAGQSLASAFALRGLFGIDAIVGHHRVWVLEVNPRLTASMEIHERALRWCAVTSHWLACVHGVVPAEATGGSRQCRPVEMHGKMVVYASHPTVIDQRLCSFVDAQNRASAFAQVTDLPAGGTAILARRPVLTVMAQGPDVNTVYRRLRTKAQGVHAQLPDVASGCGANGPHAS